MKDDLEVRASLIEKVISQYSPSGKEEGVARLIKEELERVGLKPRLDSARNVICEIGSGPRSILLCGHMDTVPGELPVRKEGPLIFGRGATDAKGALMSLLFAFEDCSELANGRIVFAAVVNEEGDSSGLNQIIKDGVTTDYAIFGEPGGVDKITVGYRGHLPMRLEVESDEVHASAPWLSPNPVEVAMVVYEKLKKGWSANSESKTNSVSISLTEMHGGSSHNVTPKHAVCSFDVRIPVGKTVSSVRAEIEATVEGVSKESQVKRIAASFGEATEPYKARLDSPLVRALNRAILTWKKNDSGKVASPSLIVKSGTGDMNTFAVACNCEAVTYGPGNTRLSHTSEENINIDDVFVASEILASAIQELFHDSIIERASL